MDLKTVNLRLCFDRIKWYNRTKIFFGDWSENSHINKLIVSLSIQFLVFTAEIWVFQLFTFRPLPKTEHLQSFETNEISHEITKWINSSKT